MKHWDLVDVTKISELIFMRFVIETHNSVLALVLGLWNSDGFCGPSFKFLYFFLIF